MKMAIISLALVPLALTAQEKLKHTDTIQRTFPAPKTVGVDNISGSIHVIGYNGQQVELTAVRTDEADTQEQLALAAREVTLKTEEKDGELQIYPDGPFRDSHSPFERRRYHEPGYHFSFEITLRVPASMNLDLRNVNKGGIAVEGVRGHFDVHEVNGGVTMKEMGGEGDVQSVNGPVQVAFSSNPTGPCKFRTVNGAVNVDLKAGLAADLEYKTLHGGVYTDFDLTGAPSMVAGKADQQNGKFVYRSHGFSKSRIGGGGPLLSFETINGEIQIHKR
ncbi:MAG TPA: hypothetical protein VGL72_10225 [Bryobacteraceae bacterium]|jgi:hypothetical protein